MKTKTKSKKKSKFPKTTKPLSESKFVKPQFTTVYIGNLYFQRTDDDIKELFKQFGRVRSAKIVMDPETHQSKGIAFVKMYNKEEAMDAIKHLDGAIRDRRTLKVSIANDRFEMIDKDREDKKNTVKKIPVKIYEKKPKVVKGKGLDVLFDYLKSK